MKSYLKKILKQFLASIDMLEAARKYYQLCIKDCNFNRNRNKILFQAVKNIKKITFVRIKTENYDALTEAILFKEMCRRARLSMTEQETFFYNPDFFILPWYRTPKNLVTIGNITVNYGDVLNKGISGLKRDIEELTQKSGNEKFCKSLLEVCNAIEIYSKRVRHFVEKNFPEREELIDSLHRVPVYPAKNLFDALQSVLIVNSLLWMNGYPLMGLGRLDQILYPFYLEDVKKGRISREEARLLLKEFVKTLHKGFRYKSNVLPGDTGQVIILGGKDENEVDRTNELTMLFLDVMKELKLPDPKVVLRVHKNTPLEIWNKAMELLSEGVGYPLFSNDDVIIPALQQFGYEIKDTYDYVVSACWEPHIPGVSFDQNNVDNLNLLEPLVGLLNEKSLSHVKSFDELLEMYRSELKVYVSTSLKRIEKMKFKPAPLLSLLTGCRERDISEGGAKYNHMGILTVGLSNTVDSLLNIKRWLESQVVNSLDEIKKLIETNFEYNLELLYDARNKGLKFGDDKEEVIALSNDIMHTILTMTENELNPFGGKYKVGFSSPSFIGSGMSLPATPDGRREKEPLGVHISPSHGEVTYVQLFNFSSKLNYKKVFNGAVTDIMIEVGFLKKNLSVFINLFKTFFRLGGAQLQCNVLNYEQLLDAIKHPDKYPNLVVRVWGFSAYFKDLPEEYKQLIVKRAKQYEAFSHKHTKVQS